MRSVLLGLRVLVVDDDLDSGEVEAMVLEAAGAHVLRATSAAEAHEVLGSGRPDVIVSDVDMPGEDGYTFIRRVRGLPVDRGGRTPAIALTARASAEERRAAFSAGFTVHATKPIAPADLVALVARVAANIAA